jgi:hypothetical protein
VVSARRTPAWILKESAPADRCAFFNSLDARTSGGRAGIIVEKHSYERDWDRQRIIDRFAVIDWMMRLPPALEDRLWQDLTNLESNKTMPYVTSVERIGYRRGHLDGRHAEASNMLQIQLEHRFGELSSQTAERIDALPVERCEALAKALLDFSGVADLEAWLQQH